MHFFQDLFRKKKPSTGIAGISFLAQGMAVALVRFGENNQLRLVYCAFIDNEQQPLEKLPKLLAHYGLESCDCHLVLTADKYQHINIEKPAVAEEELIQAIRWKINDFLSFPAEKAVIDYFFAPKEAHNEDEPALEVIASPMDELEEQLEKCRQAGLELKVIDIQEMALRNLAFHLPQNDKGIAVLHLHKYSGKILIQKRGSIYLSRKIDIGHQQLDLDAPALEDSPASLAQYKLALEIQRSLDYVENYYNMPAVTDIAIIPWADNTQKLINTLNADYGIASFEVDIRSIMNTGLSLDPATLSLCAPAIGATLRHTLEAS